MAVTKEPELIKIDKNGTKYYIDYRCPKCGGTGYLPGYEHIDSARCWKCNATGYFETRYKEYTPEYAQILADRRIARARQGADQRNAKFLSKEGFSTDGKAWIVCGDTYSIKDELKAAGAKFNGLFGWHFDHEVADYPTIIIDIDDFADVSYSGDYYFGDYSDIVERVKKLKDSAKPKDEVSTSEYVGNIGDKITIDLMYTGSVSFDGLYGTTYIHKFIDYNHNVFIWKTGGYIDADRGDIVIIKGVIKEHNEYRGEKQTVLTRCKVLNEE